MTISCLSFEANPVDVFIVQVYMQILEYNVEEVEKLYTEIWHIIHQEGCRKVSVIVMGDFNSKRCEQKAVGAYDLGRRNDRGRMLINLCPTARFGGN